MKKKSRVLLLVLMWLIALPLIAVSYLKGTAGRGREQLRPSVVTEPKGDSVDSEAEQAAALKEYLENIYNKDPDADISYALDADLIYKGSAYRYRDDLINLLFLGIDKNSDGNGRHQTDAIYLLVFDETAKKAKIIAISRNTITEVQIYNDQGIMTGVDNLQLCLAYAYAGNDDKKASALTVKAVSKLLYGTPINGYYTICMDEVFDIIDVIGGVTVTINEDMTSVSPKMTEGASVKLNSKNVLEYLRWRTEENSGRIERHKSFIKACIDNLQEAVMTNPALPLTLFDKLSSSSVTDISYESAVYLLSNAVGAGFDGFIDLPCTEGVYKTFEAQFPNEDELYEIVINTFYEKLD